MGDPQPRGAADTVREGRCAGRRGGARLRDGDTTALAGLAQESQDDAERLLRNQTPETAALVAIARGLGAFAASSFGAGFGGSVWALVGKEDAASFPPRWLSDYRARFPGRDAATAFEARPAMGLTELGIGGLGIGD